MDPREPSGQQGPHDLASSSAELQNRLLDRPEVTEFLQTLAVLSAALVPGTHCGITLRRDDTIRLHLTRKYAAATLHDELRSIGLGVEATADTTWAVRGKLYRCGLQRI